MCMKITERKRQWDLVTAIVKGFMEKWHFHRALKIIWLNVYGMEMMEIHLKSKRTKGRMRELCAGHHMQMSASPQVMTVHRNVPQITCSLYLIIERNRTQFILILQTASPLTT